MSDIQITPEERFETIVAACLGDPAITPPSGRGFGASALKVRGKIFAMLSSKGEFVVKLPRARVEMLIAMGKGKRFEPGHGRPMREWIAIDNAVSEEWLPLAHEALTFVAAGK